MDIIPVPAARFSHVHVDIVGPLPVSAAGHTHLLTVVDWSTRWPKAVPLLATTAQDCADAFVAAWVTRFGVPTTVTTDRGPQFTSAIWSGLCRKLGMSHKLTTAYHPQANGLVERMHRQLKESLRARGCGAAWADHLPWVMLGLRAAPKEASNISSAEAVYGMELRLPGQLDYSSPPSQPPPSQPPPSQPQPPPDLPQPPIIPVRKRSYAEAARGHPSLLEDAAFVYVRRGQKSSTLDSAYTGPFEVLERTAKVYRLRVGNTVESVSADRLKPHTGSTPSPDQPPHRGRPRRI